MQLLNDSVLARVYYGSIQPAILIKMSTGEGAMTLHCRSRFPCKCYIVSSPREFCVVEKKQSYLARSKGPWAKDFLQAANTSMLASWTWTSMKSFKISVKKRTKD